MSYHSSTYYKESIPEYVAVIFATTLLNNHNNDSHNSNDFDPLLVISDTTTTTTTTTTTSPTTNNNNNTNNGEGNNADTTTTTTPTSHQPHHLLPIAGIPCIIRLLHNLEMYGGFTDCIVCLDSNDDTTTTMNLLLEQIDYTTTEEDGTNTTNTNTNDNTKFFSTIDNDNNNNNNNQDNDNQRSTASHILVVLKRKNMKITVVQLNPLSSASFTSTNNNDSTKNKNVPITTEQQQQQQRIQSDHQNKNKIQQQERIIPSSTIPNNNTNNNSNNNNNNGRPQFTGSTEVLYVLEQMKLIHPISYIVLFPSDIIFLQPSIISNMIYQHQMSVSSTTTTTTTTSNNNIMILLSDYGEQDEQTHCPLKESAKAKKGIGLTRDDMDIEYIALSSSSTQQQAIQQQKRRVLWKQSKLDVEEDKYMIGATPKLHLPKSRLLLLNNSDIITVRTDWTDVHVYILPPWIRSKIVFNYFLSQKTKFLSIQHHLMKLFISRQFNNNDNNNNKTGGGIGGAILNTLGSKFASDDEKVSELISELHAIHKQQKTEFYNNNIIDFSIKENNTIALENNHNTNNNNAMSDAIHNNCNNQLLEYSVLAYTADKNSSPSQQQQSIGVVRSSSSIPAYLYANKELAHAISAASYLANITALATSNNNTAASTGPKVGTKPFQQKTQQQQHLFVPSKTVIKSKVHSLLLPNVMIVGGESPTTGGSSNIDKLITLKSTIIGMGCQIGLKCRLNNVVLHNHVKIGSNTTIQNTIVGTNAVIGDNCTLNDCIVRNGYKIPSGTKAKSDVFE